MIRKRVHWGINWMHCKVKNNVYVLIEKHDSDLFTVHVEIMAGETDEDFGKYYYGPHYRENLKEDIEEFIKGREENIKLRKATKQSS